MFSKFQMEQQVQLPLDLHQRPAEVDDRTLWLRFKNGNDLAFSVIYSRYVNRLFNYGMNACYDRELVLDCLQELFGRLWSKRTQVADVTAVNYYLLKSFRRILFARLSQRRKYNFISLTNDDTGFEFSPSVEEVLVLEEATSQQIADLKKAISVLTKRQREVIFLKFYHDLSYAEVASVMDMQVDSVYNLISKSIDSLRKILKNGYLLYPALFTIYEY